jgi:hypothetical protein
VSLSSLSETRTFFISISLCVIILNFLVMIYSLLSKKFLLQGVSRRNLTPANLIFYGVNKG